MDGLTSPRYLGNIPVPFPRLADINKKERILQLKFSNTLMFLR